MKIMNKLHSYKVPYKLKYLSKFSENNVSPIYSRSNYTKDLIMKCKEPYTLLERSICHDYNLKKKMQGKNISTV